MADFSNIPTGLKINSQIPLDIKGYALNEATLAYLGVDDNLAFTYHEGLRVVCIEERKVYEWREVGVGEENTGLVAVDFTYPPDLEETYGIDYSNRTFNFFLVNQITPETLEDYVLQIDLPEYSCQNIGLDGGPLYGDYNIESIYVDTIITGNDKKFTFAGIGVEKNTALKLNSYNYTASGNLRVINTITFDPELESSPTAEILGDGSFLAPFTVKALNPQKTVNSFPYEILPEDDLFTLFVTNAASNVVINVPDTLPDNFTCVLIQKGTGTVTINGLGATVINIPAGLTNVIKAQYHWTIIEKEGSTVEHYLGGSLIPTP